MKINEIQSLYKPQYLPNKVSLPCKQQSEQKNQNVSIADINYNCVKANFLPSFGRYKKVKDVTIKEKETGRNVTATIKKDKITNDYDFFKLFVKNKEAGFMEIGYDCIFPEDDYVITEMDNVLPSIKRIFSIAGDDYKGIGTELIKQAVEESRARGKNGCLWLTAQTGFASGLVAHRRNQSPIPFYYKMGFRATDPKLDKYIQQCLDSKKYNKLPKVATLLLSSKTAQEMYK